MLDCVGERVVGWAPLLGAAALLLVLRLALFAPRLRRWGAPLPTVGSLRALLRHGRYRGVPVREEAYGATGEDLGPFGGGRFLPWGPRGEIRLARSLLDRGDADALVVLEHERGHAERDVPAPRPYRLALVGLFLAALALGIAQPALAGPATTLMGALFAVAALHFLRNEAAASEYALRWVALRDWPPEARRRARTRLAAALGLYLADWAVAASLLVIGASLLRCR